MTGQKWRVLVVYALMAACALLVADAATLIQWIFIVVAAVHVLEFFAVYKLLKSAPGSMGSHFLHTFLFGYFHWMPIKRDQ